MSPAASATTHTLYVCYLGLREPLVQTQVLPYLRQLQSAGIRTSLLTFEPRFRQSWTREAIAAERAAMQNAGIAWHCLGYHKRPSLPATLYDVARGTMAILGLMRREGVTVLHARNHVPALMAALAKRVRGGSLLFDVRGFMPEEYVDAGVWPANGYLYRSLKTVERHLFRAADGFVLLSEKARELVFPGCSDVDPGGRPIEVIPSCVDFERFRAAERSSRSTLRAELNVASRRVIVYVGSLVGWYMIEEMTDFLAVAHQQDASTFSVILTQAPRDFVVEQLTRRGIGPRDSLVASVPPDQVPKYLRAADIGVSFIRPSYSKQSSSPTKIGEYLAAGLPIVCTAGVGDLDRLIPEHRAGVLLSEYSSPAYRQALHQVDELRREPGTAERLRRVAEEYFDVTGVGRARYLRLYQRLVTRPAH